MGQANKTHYQSVLAGVTTTKCQTERISLGQNLLDLEPEERAGRCVSLSNILLKFQVKNIYLLKAQ